MNNSTNPTQMTISTQTTETQVSQTSETPVTTVTQTTTTSTNSSLEYLARQVRARDIETARVRGWGYFLGAYLTGPIWPALVANRTGQWTPFWVGLGIGVVTLPGIFLDAGLISSIPAAGVGTAMMASKSKAKRQELDVISPDQADVLRFKDF